jgi:hypothetical protein
MGTETLPTPGPGAFMTVPRLALLVLIVALAGLLTGCGGEGDEPAALPDAVSDAGPQHIHGIGINPADGSVMIATHSGLFRAGADERRARRVGQLHQDTMGFTVVGPDRFLGSGHPDARTDLPPLLGLIRSDDAGRAWSAVSLLGEADFHVLRAAGPRIYGYDATQARVMTSADGGRTWEESRPPSPLIDLAVDPADPERILAAGEDGIAVSRDAGRTWRPLDAERSGLLAWTRRGVTLVDGGGRVHRSTDGGRTWTRRGAIGGQPSALAAHQDRLLVALHTNAVKSSTDGGRTWTVRIRP